MKKIVTSILFQFLKLTKGWPYRGKYSGKIQILMFHRVVTSLGSNRIINDGIEVTEDYLCFLIEYYLKNGFTPISINQLKSVLNENDKKRYVVFTFDDGYVDNYENALPIFEKYNIPFSIYITLDFINKKQFAWWYFIEDLIRNNDEISFIEKGIQKTISTKTNKEDAFIKLRESIQRDQKSLDSLVARYKPDMDIYHKLFLNKEQLILLSKNPLVTIGSHSISHPSLALVSDADSLFEIVNSKSALEEIISKPIKHFSYPFGTKKDVSKREIKHVETAGYLTALTTGYGDVYKEEFNLFSLPRIWTANSIKGNELLKIIYGINARKK